MQLPTISEYSRALQNEAFAFLSKELQISRVARQADLSTVQSWAGGFAVTFMVQSGANREAVRCFWNSATDLEDVQSRYAQISATVKMLDDPSIVRVNYQRDGVRTFLSPSKYFPIVRMPWIDGDPLSEWVEKWHVKANITEIRAFTDQFIQVMERLGRLGIAHGDLQHGNVLVRPDAGIVLVDYDGMYVPGMHERGLLSSRERGHQNYQHPGRGTQFNDQLDRFSSMVIVTALRTLEADRSAWGQFSNGGDNLMFLAEDFKDPDRDRGIFSYLEGIPAVRELGGRLREISSGPYDAIPALGDFLRAYVPSVPAPSRRQGADLGDPQTVIGRLYGDDVVKSPFVRLQNPAALDLDRLPGLRERLKHRLAKETQNGDIEWIYQTHASDSVDAGEAVQGAGGQGINPYRTADHGVLTDAVEPEWLRRFAKTMSVSDVPSGYRFPGAVLPSHEDFLVRLYASYHEFRLNGLHLGNSAFVSFLVGIHRRMVRTQDRLIHYEDLEVLRAAQARLLRVFERPDWGHGLDHETLRYLAVIRTRWWSIPAARWSW